MLLPASTNVGMTEFPSLEDPSWPTGAMANMGLEHGLDPELMLNEMNPFNDFLFHPLGDLTDQDWNEAVGLALQQVQR
jgi:hypothetical protein